MKDLKVKSEKIIQSDPKIKEAFKVFKEAQSNYDQSILSNQINAQAVRKGTYSSSVSEKEYNANISTASK